MRDLTILTISTDEGFLKQLRDRLHDQVAAGSRMFVAGTIDDACALLSTAKPHLVVLHWSRDGGRYGPLDRLLWTATVQARRIPVLVIAERYRTDQATMMYRLGVSEYIGRTHHLDQIGSVLTAYLPLTAASAQPDGSTVVAAPLGNSWSANHKSGSITTQAV